MGALLHACDARKRVDQSNSPCDQVYGRDICFPDSVLLSGRRDQEVCQSNIKSWIEYLQTLIDISL